MKAALLTRIGDPIEIAEVELAEPIGREVLVTVKASGLCHSDLHIVENDYGFPMPALLGHEISGIVTAVGPDVSTLSVGDHVVGSLISHCGVCKQCLSGAPYRCEDTATVQRTPDQPPRITRDGQPVLQLADLGGFAEQALVHENNLVSINKSVPFDRAALLGCGVITGAGAAINSARVRVGDTVAVIGCGGVGLNTVQGAALSGARRVIAIDLQPSKLELAKKFGATDVINPSEENLVERIREITGEPGVDHAFEVIGLTQTAQQAIDITTVGGTAYMVGMQKPEAKIEIEGMTDLLYGQKTVMGVFMGSTLALRDIPMYADLYQQGRFNLDDLVSRQIRLEDINEGYAELKQGQVARSVIVFD
ncbi:Zn-dependent alcohol dehydrogenase [Leucobacter sp. M11]|uniref:Zn-dependent alcohol dehydrogenase n=1 Tax=Leucobacter sp. M11 TaxID=2993565 RepID=UPI002D7ECAD1|nr:Zn-dependent alcohol dehydrogenase [Leucobacter sp. M11]MEB4615755.1 Zn-dependent alcohol dehydrogenase [Leucobacter sp. M11]